MGRLDGKVALITGTGGGMGRAAAQIFAREGAKVVGCDIKVEGNRETAELVRAEGGTMIGLEPLDVTVPEEALRFVETAVSEFGGIDILFNNASAQRFVPFADITPNDWEFTLKYDLDIVFRVTQYAWSHLIARGGGSIIFTASSAALTAGPSYPTAMHSTAKGGVAALTRALAAEGAVHNIRVNSMSPGTILTPAVLQHVDEATRESAWKHIPLGRMGQPEDVVYYALFLASDEASYITATDLPIDGGSVTLHM